MYFTIPIFVQFLMNVRVTSVKMGQDVSGELVIISVTVCHITRVHFVRTKVTIASYSACMHLRTAWECVNSLAAFVECENANICEHGGACIQVAGEYICDCTPYYTGAFCQNEGKKPKVELT